MQSTGLGWAGAERFLVRAFILLRSVQLAQALLVLMLNHAQYDHYPVVVALFGLQAGWSVVLLGRARRLGSYTQGAWCWSDLLLTAASVFAVASLARGGGPETWTNWMFAVGTSTVMAAAVCRRSRNSPPGPSNNSLVVRGVWSTRCRPGWPAVGGR